MDGPLGVSFASDAAFDADLLDWLAPTEADPTEVFFMDAFWSISLVGTASMVRLPGAYPSQHTTP